jgi:hypothetical protein
VAARSFSACSILGCPVTISTARGLGLARPNLLDDPAEILLHLTCGDLEEGAQGPGTGFSELETDTAGWIVGRGEGSFGEIFRNYHIHLAVAGGAIRLLGPHTTPPLFFGT